MQTGVIAVYDREPDYAIRLSEYISRQTRLTAAVTAYTEESELKKAIRSGRIRLVVAGQTEEELEEESLPVLRLTEEKSGRPMTVYKYQPAGKILQIVENTAREIMPLAGTRAAVSARIRGVYAPSGGCGKTTLALLMGILLAERQQVLYLNLEAHSGFRTLMQCQYQADLSDVLVMMRQGEDMTAKLPQLLQQFEGLSYLAPVVWPEDIYETSPQEWRELVARLADSGMFDEIILDVGLDFPCPEEVLACCGRIYRPEKPEAVARAKNAEYDSYLAASDRTDLLSRIVPVPLEETDRPGDCRSFDQWERWQSLMPVVKKLLRDEGAIHE